METTQSWLSDPTRLWHIALSAAVFYVYIVAIVRISGKRTVTNMNNSDWIVTISVGSMMASGILLQSVSMLDAMVAVAVVTALQWATAWAVLRSEGFARLVKPKPRLLVHKGELLRDALRRERVSEDEVKSALREAGMARLEDANWMVIETNGVLTAVPRSSLEYSQADLFDGVHAPAAVVGQSTGDERSSADRNSQSQLSARQWP